MKNVLLVLVVLATTPARADIDDDGDKIMNRLFPKAKTVELGVAVDYLLNAAFVDTTLVEASVRYSFTESWGLGLTFGQAQTKDRKERKCVETFYNDPKQEVSAECMNDDGGEGLDQATEANVGPAYAPIRELRNVASLYGDYSLAYGKMIFLHGMTGHFDLRLRFGGGVTISDYYAQQPEQRTPGVPRDDSTHYGDAGRPAPERQTTPHLYIALAEDLLFLKRFSFGAELAYYMLVGTPQSIEQFVVMKLVGGVRF